MVKKEKNMIETGLEELEAIEVNGKNFTHRLNIENGEVYLMDEDENILLIFDLIFYPRASADAVTKNVIVRDENGQVGEIRQEGADSRWVYYENPLRTRLVYCVDLLLAEVEVSIRYITKTDCQLPRPKRRSLLTPMTNQHIIGSLDVNDHFL
jgi:hypothetical protein